jgi:hypothetical protein
VKNQKRLSLRFQKIYTALKHEFFQGTGKKEKEKL